MSFVEGNLSLDIQLAPGTLERLQRQLTNLEKGVRVGVSADTKGLQAGVRGVDNLNAAAQRTAQTVQSKLGGAVKATAATFGVLGAAGGAGLVAIATKAIMAGKEFNVLQQQVRASLTAILGTSTAAEGLLTKVNKLNDTSPFPRSAFLSATQQLVGFGVSAEKVTPILDSVQEAVAGIGGDANDIQMFTRAFAQIQSQGRLTGDVLFSLGAKGVDAAAIIGKQMGKTGTEIKEEVTKGSIGAEEAIDALTKGLKSKFNGAVENVAKSYVGAADRVKARLRDIGADITKAFINPLGGGAAVDGLNNIAVGLSNIRKNVISQLLPGIQSFADLFVKATKAFMDFTANIKPDSVKQFLEMFKMLAPLVALVGTKLIQSLTAGIPILKTFTGALSGPVIALVLFAATVPAAREAIMKMVAALRPAVEAILPALANTLKTAAGVITTMAPLLTGLASAFGALISVATPLLKLLEFGPVQAILTVLIAKFLLMKVVGSGAFQSITYAAIQATASMKAASYGAGGVAGGVGKIAGAANIGKSAVMGIGSALGGLVNPVTIIATGMMILAQRAADAQAAADKLVASIRDGLDIDKPEDFAAAMGRLDKNVKSANKSARGFFDWRMPFGKEQKDADIAGRALKGYKKERDALLGARAIKDNIISDVMKVSGKSIEEVTAKAKELGIVLSSIAGDRVADTVKKINDAFNETPTEAESPWGKIKAELTTAADAMDKVRGAQDKLKESQKGVATARQGVKAAEKALADLRRTTAQELKDNVTKAELSLADARRGVAAAADRLIAAELSLTQAKRGVAQADERLVELTKQRNALLADTTKAVREVASAEADAVRIKQELLDQDQQRTALLRTQAELAATSGDKLAAADRAILRAKIALNSATREEKELLDELNETQTVGVDLSGLTVEQIKVKLAGVRAELSAQRTITKVKKTQGEIDDEKQTAQLNVLDAEQAHKEAIQNRATLEYDMGIQARETQESLNSLALDQEATLRRQHEQQIVLSALRHGDTVTAATLKQLDLDIITATEGITTAALTLKGAEREVWDAIDDQRGAAIAVRDAQRETETAAHNIRVHSDSIKTAQQDIRTAVEGVRDAQKTVKDDAFTLRGYVADMRGDQGEINRLLGERIGLNRTIMTQNPDMVRKMAENILGPGSVEVGNADGPVLVDRNGNLNKLIDILTNHPERLPAFLKSIGMGDGPGAGYSGGTAYNRVQSALGAFPAAHITSTLRTPAHNASVGGSPTSYHLDRNNPAVDIGGPTNVLDALYRRLASMGGWRELLWQVKGHYDHIHAARQGGIATQDTLTQIAEGGKAEVVLPLTKPGRAMTLLAQSMPFMHTALQKRLSPALSPRPAMGVASIPTVSSVISPFGSAVRRGTSTRSNPFVSRSDGPVTYGQLEELIELIRNQKGDIRVEAPVTVEGSRYDEALARKISKQVERRVNEILSRR